METWSRFSVYWQFNYDAPGQTGSFLQSRFEYMCLTSFFSSVFASHMYSASNSLVSEISEVVLTFFMVSETRWKAVENVVFFSKRSIVIKLPVKLASSGECKQ